MLQSTVAHGGLVHVVMRVLCLTFEGLETLLLNSPKLLTLCLNVDRVMIHKITVIQNVDNYNARLKKLYQSRKLFKVGLYRLGHTNLEDVLLYTDLHPLWICDV